MKVSHPLLLYLQPLNVNALIMMDSSIVETMDAIGIVVECSIDVIGSVIHLQNADRVTGNDACCVCGGGSFDSIPTDPSAAPVSTTSPTSNPTVSTEPTSSPTDSPSVCEDVDGWVNSFGNDCGWYGFLRCGFFGDSFENDGLVASEACCACK
jgi:hypothetical protein